MPLSVQSWLISASLFCCLGSSVYVFALCAAFRKLLRAEVIFGSSPRPAVCRSAALISFPSSFYPGPRMCEIHNWCLSCRLHLQSPTAPGLSLKGLCWFKTRGTFGAAGGRTSWALRWAWRCQDAFSSCKGSMLNFPWAAVLTWEQLEILRCRGRRTDIKVLVSWVKLWHSLYIHMMAYLLYI